jgi:hypothetical protein
MNCNFTSEEELPESLEFWEELLQDVFAKMRAEDALPPTEAERIASEPITRRILALTTGGAHQNRHILPLRKTKEPRQ